MVDAVEEGRVRVAAMTVAVVGVVSVVRLDVLVVVSGVTVFTLALFVAVVRMVLVLMLVLLVVAHMVPLSNAALVLVVAGVVDGHEPQ